MKEKKPVSRKKSKKKKKSSSISYNSSAEPSYKKKTIKSSHSSSSKKKMPSKKRTSAGNITKKVRDKTATLSDDRFPIFDVKSAKSALILRGRGTTDAERQKIIRKAAKFAPEEAKKARASDKKKGI